MTTDTRPVTKDVKIRIPEDLHNEPVISQLISQELQANHFQQQDNCGLPWVVSQINDDVMTAVCSFSSSSTTLQIVQCSS